MAITYEPCGTDVTDLIAEILKAHHQEVARYAPRISAIFVTRESKKLGHTSALKLRGFPVAAKTQITPLADRARGEADAKLTIDSYAWKSLPIPQRRALIDHELQHLELKATKKGGHTDDLGRPRLGIQTHDWELTGFQAVMERNGENALEAIALHRFAADYGTQLSFAFPGEEAHAGRESTVGVVVRAIGITYPGAAGFP